MSAPHLAACVDACRALLEDEPELLADFAAIFTDAGIRWERLPDDLRLGFADIAWEHLQGEGLAPGPGDRRFIRRSERRCPACGGAEPDPWWNRCRECVNTGWVRLEERDDARPPTLCAALTLAGLGPAMLEAEALARAATAALWPWRGRRGALPHPSAPPTTIAWRVHEEATPLLLMRGTEALCPLLFEALMRAVNERQRHDLSRLFYRLFSAYEHTRQAQWKPDPAVDQAAADFYDALAASGETVSPYGVRGMLPGCRGPWHRPFAPVGQGWADLPNPFTPLVRLWELGVAVERLEADTIVLALAAA